MTSDQSANSLPVRTHIILLHTVVARYNATPYPRFTNVAWATDIHYELTNTSLERLGGLVFFASKKPTLPTKPMPASMMKAVS